MKISTERYESAHGKKPKGCGLWVFENKSKTIQFTAHGTFVYAKKSAIKNAKTYGLTECYVCS